MKLRIQLTSIALLAVCAVGHAAEPGESVTVTLDNDVFTSSDNNYTNGLGVSWVSAEIQRYDEDRFVRKWARFWSFLPFVSDDGYDTYESWSLVQEMDTPDDIKNPNPPANDQPYAGILYVDAVLYAKKDRWAHAWELKVGVVGPAAQGSAFFVPDRRRDERRARGAGDVGPGRGWPVAVPADDLWRRARQVRCRRRQIEEEGRARRSA